MAKVSTIAIRSSPTSSTFSRIISTSGNLQEQFCGLGPACSIEGGTATAARERLLRREALEVALYTFKFVPSVNAVIAYMPPPPGQAPSTLLYLERSNLSQELSKPIVRTLPLATPPLPTVGGPEGVAHDRRADAAGRVRLPVRGADGRDRGDDPDALDLSRPPAGARRPHVPRRSTRPLAATSAAARATLTTRARSACGGAASARRPRGARSVLIRTIIGTRRATLAPASSAARPARWALAKTAAIAIQAFGLARPNTVPPASVGGARRRRVRSGGAVAMW